MDMSLKDNGIRFSGFLPVSARFSSTTKAATRMSPPPSSLLKTLVAFTGAATLAYVALSSSPQGRGGESLGLAATGTAARTPAVRRCVGTRAKGQGMIPSKRRSVALGLLAATGFSALSSNRESGASPLCDDACDQSIGNVPLQTTRSGLQYRDIKVGEGEYPPKAFDVVVHYSLKIDTGNGIKEFFSSFDAPGRPLDVRVGTGMVIPGLDEGLSTMKKGGIRRLYIPGKLSFPNGVKSKVGKPAVPPRSDIIADVQLIYIPGIDDDLEVAGAGEDE